MSSVIILENTLSIADNPLVGNLTCESVTAR
jgi:hypothetical protein